jgi:translation initiation factor 3 subunit H
MDGEGIESNLVKEVVMDSLTAMRIVKHCNENLPSMVAGSLLGLDQDGVLEITYSYPFPQPKSENDNDLEDIDGAEYQLEMMKLLREVNIDNNCVGWYQSMDMGTIFTNDVISYQYSYQSSEELSENSVVIMYDPLLSKNGDIVLKAYRLSQTYLEMKKSRVNKYIPPSDILEEVPLTIRADGHIAGFVSTLSDSHIQDMSTEYEALSMSNHDGTLTKQLEMLSAWMDDLLNEQQRFQSYARSNAKTRQEHIRWLLKRRAENKELRDNGEELKSMKLEDSNLKPLPELTGRNDHLLIVAQVEKYTEQVDDLSQNVMDKMTLLKELNVSN